MGREYQKSNNKKLGKKAHCRRKHHRLISDIQLWVFMFFQWSGMNRWLSAACRSKPAKSLKPYQVMTAENKPTTHTTHRTQNKRHGTRTELRVFFHKHVLTILNLKQ